MAKGKSKKKRINITISESYLEEASARGIKNLSAHLDDLLGDYLAESKITLTVNAATKRLYDQIIGTTGFSDADIEDHLRPVFEGLLDQKILELETLRQQVGKRDNGQ